MTPLNRGNFIAFAGKLHAQEDTLEYSCTTYGNVKYNPAGDLLPPNYESSISPEQYSSNKKHLAEKRTAEEAKINLITSQTVANTRFKKWICHNTPMTGVPADHCGDFELQFHFNDFTGQPDAQEKSTNQQAIFESYINDNCDVRPENLYSGLDCLNTSLELISDVSSYLPAPPVTNCTVLNDYDEDEVPNSLDQCPYTFGVGPTKVFGEFYPDSAKRGCLKECGIGKEIVNGECKQICNAGEVRNSAGTCIVSCPKFTKFNTTTNECDCTIKDVSPPTSAASANAEAHDGKFAGWERNSDGSEGHPLIRVRYECLKSAVQSSGIEGSKKPDLTLQSGWRSADYQSHLLDVWNAKKKLPKSVPDACVVIVKHINSEFEKHGLSDDATPATNSKHSTSTAADLNWNSNNSEFIPNSMTTIDKLAKTCGLCRPFPLPELDPEN